MGKLFNELMEGMQALELHLKGKITLKTTVVEVPDPIAITPEEVKAIRQKLNLSQAVLLLKMVEKSPKTFEQIASI
ncbi:transcriptional regulator [Glaesserella parasuis]|uniref:transcriptional regulator n=1 Tax=Glaesserella parasuis TaxID=738 RepID=UPI00136563F9|nr:transcriptional regulator [Glaesserella parasuis]MDG6240166.1 transcriptional regulator [Glaesserella parasuis]MDO9748067.1 transcriptional regulator [Glaesserella parasuis]MDO9772279.1 transcriptional regulator [Glaesserella parasuis]MDO9774421.1 transcriptional regulator [Glaesserella parasuis]MDO9804029.1 transcriptional regulator [Glaesserella parasuis]